jgi:PDZ domain-containing protein
MRSKPRKSVRRLVGRGLAALAILAALALFALWRFPSSDFLFLPNTAQPLTGLVSVEGSHPTGGRGAIYYLDVTERQATWLERLLPFTRPDGASLVPNRDVVPSGISFDTQHKLELQDMQRSQQVAAAVALRQAGLRVVARPTGVLVEGVFSNVPAAKVLRAGDVIVGVNGHAVLSRPELRALLAAHVPGDVVSVRLRRGGKPLIVSVKTVSDPEEPKRPLIGVYRASQAAAITLPLKVHIDLGGIGGPSAGLPFALDVLELLGKNVTHGYKIAATGELDLDGSVSPIGGVKQKTFGARRAGVDVLLVPAGENAAEARRYAGGLRVIPVESFQQALHALATLPPKS